VCARWQGVDAGDKLSVVKNLPLTGSLPGEKGIPMPKLSYEDMIARRIDFPAYKALYEDGLIDDVVAERYSERPHARFSLIHSVGYIQT
jgi:hypothetical protein